MTDEEELFGQLEGVFDEVESDVYEDLAQIPLMELYARRDIIDEELGQRKELLHPRSDRGRELHSLRTPLTVEILKREEESRNK